MNDSPPPSASIDQLASASDSSLLDYIFSGCGKSVSDANDPAIEALAKLHNEGNVDVLALLTPAALEKFKGPKLFVGQHIYRLLIGKINAPTASLVRALGTLMDAAGSDLAAGLPANDLGKWCEGDPSRPEALLNQVERGADHAEKFLIVALTRGAAVNHSYFVERAYRYIDSGTDLERLHAIQALGQITLLSGQDWNDFTTRFEEAIAKNRGDTDRSAILRATLRKIKQAPTEYQAPLRAIVASAIAPLGDNTLNACAWAISDDLAGSNDPMIENFLDALLSLNPEHRSTIDQLDIGLVKLVEAGKAQQAQQFLKQLFSKDSNTLNMGHFDSLRYKLIVGERVILEDWFVTWLRSGNHKLCNQLSEYLFDASMDEFKFEIDFSRFALKASEFAFLARKVIGYFFLKPAVMVSFVASLMRHAPTTETSEILTLFYEHILVNYGGVGKRLLKKIADDSNDPASRRAQYLVKELETYHASFDAVGEIKELHPSERERQIAWQRHSDQMQDAHKSASEKSFVHQLFKKSVLLYGNSAITYLPLPSGPLHRTEAKLGTISASFEMPHTDILDPLGLQFVLINFKSEPPPA
ncbi:MAG: hypothetical protein ING44_02705 [Telmatospirillum sp.]|nr:hypothetical protein [Telmatospirillum sp.]